MLKKWLHKRIEKQADMLGVDLPYQHDLLDAAPGAFMRFAMAAPSAAHHKTLPAHLLAACHLTAAQLEDCGPCVQIAINMSRAAGVSPDDIRAMLANDDNLDEDVKLVMAYTHALLTRAPEFTDQLERIRARFGEQGLAELALSATMGRMYPVLKKGLGHGASCGLMPPNPEGIRRQQTR